MTIDPNSRRGRMLSQSNPIKQIQIRTQAEVGEILGITSQAVGLIEKQAFRKIRNRLKGFI